MEIEKTTVFERHPVKMAESESISENKTEPKSLRQRWKDHRDQIANRVSRFPLTNRFNVGILSKLGNMENESTCQPLAFTCALQFRTNRFRLTNSVFSRKGVKFACDSIFATHAFCTNHR